MRLFLKISIFTFAIFLTNIRDEKVFVLDNLSYDYGSKVNQLQNIADAADPNRGFKAPPGAGLLISKNCLPLTK